MTSVLLIIFAVFAGAIILFLMYGVGIFNRLVTLRNRVDNAFAQSKSN